MAQGRASPSFGARFGDVTPQGPVPPLQVPPLPSSRSGASPCASCPRQASGERGRRCLWEPSTALAPPAPLPLPGFGMLQFSPSLADPEEGGHPRLASPQRSNHAGICRGASALLSPVRRETTCRERPFRGLPRCGAGPALPQHPPGLRRVLAAPAAPWLQAGGGRDAVSPRVTGILLGFAPWQSLLAQSPLLPTAAPLHHLRNQLLRRGDPAGPPRPGTSQPLSSRAGPRQPPWLHHNSFYLLPEAALAVMVLGISRGAAGPLGPPWLQVAGSASAACRS